MDIYRALPDELKYIINIYLRNKDPNFLYQLKFSLNGNEYPDSKFMKRWFRANQGELNSRWYRNIIEELKYD